MQAVTILVDACLDGRIEPHQLPDPLHILWCDGFRHGTQAAQKRVDRAESDANYWYYVANNPEDARRHHREGLQLLNVMQSRASTQEQWAELDRIAAQRAAEAAR